MKDYLKFLAKLPAKLRIRVILVLDKIAHNDLKNLDIKSLSGKDSGKGKFYRCRVGKVRIVFLKRDLGNVVFEVAFRGEAYKKK